MNLVYSKRTYIIIGLLLTGIVIVGVITYFTKNITAPKAGEIDITINLVPKDAKLIVDGVEQTAVSLRVKEGIHTFHASKPGFSTYSRDEYVSKSKDPNINISLGPESEEAKKWSQDNQILYNENERRGAQKAQEDGKKFRDKNTIVNHLPYKNYIYTIGYRANPADPSGDTIIIEIDASEGNREYALAQIRRWGIDPTEYIINFKDYTNPFSL